MTHLDPELLACDAAALHTAHTAGTWHPMPEETAAADHLARGQWNAALFDAVLRAIPGLAGGSLAGVLAVAAAVLEDPAADDRPEVADALLRLRQLVDVMTEAA
ncbi:hypothetical protein E4198_00020 [Streptomyces sp. RKND-216]|uniref:hypothetical protein n=1 Tax=Streptomyces sp. RKND-216 TaxID=2562581 RepID=UPI00109DCCBD|nr:hypothetical protein [Streptomyces sp. RKND-216]THA28236.1 hypothetical protein E4198_00020 [Streptomyces sp. RKND-216]